MENRFCKLFLEDSPKAERVAGLFGRLLSSLYGKDAKARLGTRFFLDKEGIEERELLLHLRKKDISSLVDAGLLVQLRGGGFRSGVMVHKNLMDFNEPSLNPVDPWFIATDWPDIPLDEDHDIGINAVFPIHYESICLMCRLTEEHELSGKDVLDIFCGSGVFAVFCALSGARSVIASDINARALAFTRLNAILNKVGQKVEISKSNVWSHRDFSSLADKQFDLILANPPFEPGPSPRYPLHSYGGPEGQDHMLAFLDQAPERLSECGFIVAVDFSPGSTGGQRGGVFADRLIRRELEKIIEESDALGEISYEFRILDRMPLDLFAIRFAFLPQTREEFPIWRLDSERKGFRYLYLTLIEIGRLSSGSTDIDTWATNDQRCERVNRYSAWENPLHWPVPCGITEGERDHWYNTYLQFSQYFKGEHRHLRHMVST